MPTLLDESWEEINIALSLWANAVKISFQMPTWLLISDSKAIKIKFCFFFVIIYNLSLPKYEPYSLGLSKKGLRSQVFGMGSAVTKRLMYLSLLLNRLFIASKRSAKI